MYVTVHFVCKGQIILLIDLRDFFNRFRVGGTGHFQNFFFIIFRAFFLNTSRKNS